MGVPASFVAAHTTVGPITLAVNGGTGSDDPTDTRPPYILSGDHSAEPFETIQAALDTLPRSLVHEVIVEIAAGTYVGFVAQGFLECGVKATLGATNLTIKGARGLQTLTTGSNQATGTSGTNRSVTVSGENWTVDELVGSFVEVTSGAGSGQILVVAKNTADTIHFATKPSPALGSGSVFDITVPTVIIDTSFNNYAGGQIQNCTGRVVIQDMTSDGPVMGFSVHNSAYGDFRRTVAKNNAYGYHAQDTTRTAYNEIAAIGCTYGQWIYNVDQYANQYTGILVSGCNYGLSIDSVRNAYQKGVWVRDCVNRAGWIVNSRIFVAYDWMFDTSPEGFYVELVYVAFYGVEVSNCGVYCLGAYNAELWLSNYLSGSSNTGWAIDANGSNTTVMLANSIPVTIATTGGEVTLDGTVDIGWAALASANDYAVFEPKNNRVVRQ